MSGVKSSRSADLFGTLEAVVVFEKATVLLVTTALLLRSVLSGPRVVALSANAEVSVDLNVVGVNCFDAALLCSLATVDFAAVVDIAAVSLVKDLVEGCF